MNQCINDRHKVGRPVSTLEIKNHEKRAIRDGNDMRRSKSEIEIRTKKISLFPEILYTNSYFEF